MQQKRCCTPTHPHTIYAADVALYLANVCARAYIVVDEYKYKGNK